MNGTLRFSNIGGTFRYKYRTANAVYGIYDRDDPQREFSIYLNSSTRVMLDPFFHLRVIGTAGTGRSKHGGSVSFYVPVKTEQTVQHIDGFDDGTKSGWEEVSTQGTHAVADVQEGGKALKVTSTVAGAGGMQASLIAFKPSDATVNLQKARNDADGFLSYDAQVKIGFNAAALPDYFGAGLSFRLDRSGEEGNFYGLSLMRGNNHTNDGIDDLVFPGLPEWSRPQNDRLSLVLWEQPRPGKQPAVAGVQRSFRSAAIGPLRRRRGSGFRLDRERNRDPMGPMGRTDGPFVEDFQRLRCA